MSHETHDDHHVSHGGIRLVYFRVYCAMRADNVFVFDLF